MAVRALPLDESRLSTIHAITNNLWLQPIMCQLCDLNRVNSLNARCYRIMLVRQQYAATEETENIYVPYKRHLLAPLADSPCILKASQLDL